LLTVKINLVKSETIRADNKWTGFSFVYAAKVLVSNVFGRIWLFISRAKIT